MSQKQEGKLRKEIGVFGGVSLVAGMTIGSGIYYLGSYVLERTNMTQGAALLCWIIGGIVAVLVGICLFGGGKRMYHISYCANLVNSVKHVDSFGGIGHTHCNTITLFGTESLQSCSYFVNFFNHFFVSDFSIKILQGGIVRPFTGCFINYIV